MTPTILLLKEDVSPFESTNYIIEFQMANGDDEYSPRQDVI